MKIHDISISNFRGIKNVTQLTCGSINTIVGKNDSGKSCLIKALDAFFNKKFIKEDISYHRAEGEFTEITIRFIPSVDVHPFALDIDNKICITKRFSFTNAGKLDIKTSYTCNDVLHPKIENCFGVNEDVLNNYLGEELNLEVKKSGRKVTNISKILKIYEETRAFESQPKAHDAELYIKNIEKYYGLKLPIFSIFDAEYNLDVNNTDFQKQFKTLVNDSLDRNRELTSKIETEVKKGLTNEFDEIKTLMSKNVPELESIQPTIICNWGNLVKFDLNLRFKNEEQSVPLSHKGTGFKRLLMVAYFEYLAAKLTDENQIFAIEEPETYLHPSLQQELLSSIQAISQTSQFFITTHSPVFAGATDSSDIIIVKKQNFISSYYKHSEETEIIKEVIKELGIRPNYNLLKSANFIIFTEGFNDIHFLQNYASTVLGKDLNKDKIICTIGGGSALSNYADLDLFKKLSNGQSEKYAVFVDGDNGDQAKETPLNKIKSHCEKDKALFCRLSKRDIENYCHSEAIRRVYIDSIILKEGPLSRNPVIQQFRETPIIFDRDDLDVDAYLKAQGFHNFKDGHNINVFQSMTIEEWKAMDTEDELYNFFKQVYERVDNKDLDTVLEERNISKSETAEEPLA